MDTLPDHPCRPGGVLLVGINPSPVSVAAGHYYQGRLGQRLWARLRRVGLLADEAAEWEDDAYVAAGNGLTDLVKRPTAQASGLTPKELAGGRDALAAKARDWKPGLLLFAFRPPAEALFGRGVSSGPCGAFEGIPAFLMSGPYASRAITEANDALLVAALGGSAITPAAPEATAHEASARVPTGPSGGPTQHVTAVDLRTGRIRLPARSSSGAKAVFPVTKGDVDIVLRGHEMRVPYDPRLGPDRRSGVLTIGTCGNAPLARPRRRGSGGDGRARRSAEAGLGLHAAANSGLPRLSANSAARRRYPLGHAGRRLEHGRQHGVEGPGQASARVGLLRRPRPGPRARAGGDAAPSVGQGDMGGNDHLNWPHFRAQ